MANVNIDEQAGEVKLPLHSLIAALQTTDSNPGPKYILHEARYSGVSKPGHCVVECKINCEVIGRGHSAVGSGADANARLVWVPLFKRDIALLSHSVVLGSGRHCTAGYCSVANGEIGAWLEAPQETGVYIISLLIGVPYQTARETGIRFDIPQTVVTKVEFEVGNPNVKSIKIDPCHNREVPTHLKNGVATASCIIPSASAFISVQWTVTDVSSANTTTTTGDVVPEEPLSFTAQWDHLFTVGEGLLVATSLLQLNVKTGKMSSLNVEVDPRLRLQSVDHQALKDWDVSSASSSKGPNKVQVRFDRLISNEQQTVTFVSEMSLLESSSTFSPLQSSSTSSPSANRHDSAAATTTPEEVGGEGEHTPFLVHVERAETVEPPSLDDSIQRRSLQVVTPYFRMATCSPVERESGWVGIEAKTNIEIEIGEKGSRGIAATDPYSLPDSIRQAASNPIIWAGRANDPSGNVQLDIYRHKDVQVLTAFVKSCHVTLYQTQEGRLMSKVVAHVENTYHQYLRVWCPNSDIWSLGIDGEPVKPSQDKDCYLIPLPKAKKGTSKTLAIVELVMMKNVAQRFGSRGSAVLKVPKFDLPIGILFVSVYIPNGYRYEKLVSDLRYDTKFRGELPCEWQEKASTEKERRFREISSQNISQQISRGESLGELVSCSMNLKCASNRFQKKSSFGLGLPKLSAPKLFGKKRDVAPAPLSVNVVKRVGTKGVLMETPTPQGKLYRFVRSAVTTSQHFDISIPYSQIPKRSWWLI